MAQLLCPSTQCKQVLKSHNKCVDQMSECELISLLKKGVLVDGNTLYWADANLLLSCEKYARALNIVHGSNPKHWTYKTEKIWTGDCIEVADLLSVCWLEVTGKFSAKMLAPCTWYDVLFDIKMTPCAAGWNKNVNFTLTTPDGCKIESQKDFNQYKGKGYKEISIGKFKTQSCLSPCSNVDFRMYEIVGGLWKSGLAVRGVIIRPAKSGC